MSSSELSEGDITLIKAKIIPERAATTASPQESPFETEFAEIGKDLGKVGKGALKSLEGFRTFILRGNVIDLAIGIVVGGAFTLLVNSLVSDVITPLIPVYKGSLSNATWKVPWASGAEVAYGAFINTIISFLIVAAVLYYFVVQPVNALMKIYKPKEAALPPKTQDCPYCFQSVNVKATRCPYCTSSLVPVAEAGKEKEKVPVLMLPESLESLSDKIAEQIIRKATAQLEKIAETPIPDVAEQ